MADKDLKLNLMLKAHDTMSGVVKSACRQSDEAFEKMNKTLEKTAGKFDNYGKKLAIFGGVVTAASGINVKTAGDFEERMNNVSTLIDTGVESLSEMSDEVLKIGKTSPKSINDLAEGLYLIRSAGVSAADQFKVLKGSEMLAVSGLSTTAEAVDLATSAINAFGLEGEKQSRVYDVFFKAVKAGKTTVSEYAQGFGNVAGVVSAADIQLEEYTAAVAAMTTNGIKSCTVHTQMQAVIAGLSRSSKEQTEIFNKLGAKSFKDLINKSGGLVNALGKIKTAVGGDESKIISLVGSVRAYNAVMTLTGAANQKYLDTLADMRGGADALSEAYAKQTAGFNNQMRQIGNQLQALSIKLGNALLPILESAGRVLGGVLNLIDRMPDGLTRFISVATAGIGAVALLGGTGLMVTANVIRSLNMLRIALRGISIAAWANPALIPILAVAAGIAALAAGVVYCYKKFEGFRAVCSGAWAVVKAGGAWIAVLWQSFISGAEAVWDFIAPAVKFGATVLAWTTPIGIATKAIKGLINWIGGLIEKAGGIKGIMGGITNWAGARTASAEELNAQIRQNRKEARAARTAKAADGSHAAGLDYVPFDGYRAELHKGESVLTSAEAQRWRSEKTSGGFSPVIKIDFRPSISMQNTASEDRDDLLAQLAQYRDELVRMVTESLARQSARAY